MNKEGYTTWHDNHAKVMRLLRQAINEGKTTAAKIGNYHWLLHYDNLELDIKKAVKTLWTNRNG